jgi:hypothetical protein
MMVSPLTVTRREVNEFLCENKTVTQLKGCGRIVKIYNELATTLVTFESLWFAHWTNLFEGVKTALRACYLSENWTACC